MALSLAYTRAARHPLPERLVVFSDLHRGVRDPADDHERCEPAMCAALAHYHSQGWHLALLGDVDELWENDRQPVLSAYTVEQEAIDAFGDRLWRFYGNHDEEYSSDSNVHEAVRFEHAGRTLFLAHGHQGTDSHPRLSRWVVRNLWRWVQVRADVGVRPSQDYGLRGRTNRSLHDWAKGHSDRPILVAGHTHKPVFWDSTPPIHDRPTTKRVLGGDVSALAFQKAQARTYREPFTMSAPVYFNTGCCCFDDGDITSLEIERDGDIRLVKWSGQDGTRTVLAQAPLSDVLEATEISTATVTT